MTSTLLALAAATPHGSVIPGLVVGGVLIVVGLIGGIYGQKLRRRGRRPPRA